MNDRHSFEMMLMAAHAEYEVTEPGENATTEIRVENWSANSNYDLGYPYFYSEWFFNAAGDLIGVGHWE